MEKCKLLWSLFERRQFTKDGGDITVKAADNGDEVEVSVNDTGMGMPESRKKRLFHIGEMKLSAPDTDGRKGTGLGLILCKEFIEKHGGAIWIESESGRGTTVAFTLPKTDVIQNQD